MARWKDASPVYAVAELFRQRCLLDQASLLRPNNRALTPENIDAFWEAFIGRPNEGWQITAWVSMSGTGQQAI